MEEGFNHPETINRRQSLEEKWTERRLRRLSEKFLHNSSITLPGQPHHFIFQTTLTTLSGTHVLVSYVRYMYPPKYKRQHEG